ncbi:MAG: XRE family transcriptional regulator [Candidatus Dormiibacterota bacterium]
MTATSDNGVPSQEIGDRLRRLRLSRGVSLRQVAQIAQMTPSFLSQVELNQVAPSIVSLRRLCAAMDISLVELLQHENTPLRSLVRAGARQRLVAPGQTAIIELLAEAPGRPFEMVLVRLAPEEASADEFQSHGARECVYILSGRVKFELGGTSEILHTGDSIFFASTTPHRFVNLGKREASIISCVVGEM